MVGAVKTKSENPDGGGGIGESGGNFKIPTSGEWVWWGERWFRSLSLFFQISINGMGNVVNLSKQNPTNCLSLMFMGGHLFLLNSIKLHVILSLFMDIHNFCKCSIGYLFIGSILFPCNFPSCSLNFMVSNYFRTHQQNPRSPANVPLTGKRPNSPGKAPSTYKNYMYEGINLADL